MESKDSKEYLFLASIGPVQEFIATARRSRDLWFGSYLLSELSKAAARSIHEYGGTLIFPAPEEDRIQEDLQRQSDLSVANKVLAKVSLAPNHDVTSFAQSVKNAIDEELSLIRRETFNRRVNGNDSKSKKIKECINNPVATRQIEDLVEYYWVAIPYSNTENDYVQTRQRLEALLAARKVTRDFFPVTWGSERHKSSLDGQRESVILERYYAKQGDSDEEKERKEQEIYNDLGAGAAERLSGVDLLKRLGEPEKALFMSTPYVAALPFLQRLEQEVDPKDAKQKWDKYLGYFNKLGGTRQKISSKHVEHPIIGHSEGTHLFVDRLPEILGTRLKDHLASAQGELNNFFNETVGKDIRPQPYYAILVADGDGMGKVIDNQKTIEDHQQLSRKLDTFAESVKEIVRKHSGSLIFAGGDDVIALLPLHTALDCTYELATTFKGAMQGFADKKGRKPTLSAGIAITHFLQPISDSLNLARSAEKIAKGVDGKNALAITISKRSGTDRTIKGKWEPDSKDEKKGATEETQKQEEKSDGKSNEQEKPKTKIYEDLNYFICLHRQQQIPNGAAYEIVNLVDQYGDVLPIEAIQKEVIRILKRKRTSGNKELETKVSEKLKDIVQAAATAEDIKQLAYMLITARTFADAYDLAQKPLNPNGNSDICSTEKKGE